MENAKNIPSNMRLSAMIKRLNLAINSQDEYENMFAGELVKSMLKSCPEYFDKLLNNNTNN